MDSALTPREIQARIRAGETLEDVAAAAGTEVSAIEPFAGPVLAEREHVVRLALGCPVRRRGESSSARSLSQVVGEHLLRQGVDQDTVDWDAWRDPDRRWSVVASFEDGGQQQRANFGFDTRGRFSTARDDLARRLIGEQEPAAAPPADPDDEPTIDLDEGSRRESAHAEGPGSDVTGTGAPLVSGDDRAPDDSSPGHTRDDLVGHESQMDVLYDMLSAFDEDSVNIYADLSMPVVEDAVEEEDFAAQEPVEEPDDQDLASEKLPSQEPTGQEPTGQQPTGEVQSGQKPPSQDLLRDDEFEADKPAPNEPATSDERTSGSRGASGRQAKPVPAEPEQDPLLDDPAPAPAKPKPRSRRGRASIPSWDEIMFGGPKPQ